MEPIDPFVCPRCGLPAAQERFYGPCSACRGDLSARQGGPRQEAASVRFEPKMHVTPNAVATKD